MKSNIKTLNISLILYSNDTIFGRDNQRACPFFVRSILNMGSNGNQELQKI